MATTTLRNASLVPSNAQTAPLPATAVPARPNSQSSMISATVPVTNTSKMEFVWNGINAEPASTPTTTLTPAKAAPRPAPLAR